MKIKGSILPLALILLAMLTLLAINSLATAVSNARLLRALAAYDEASRYATIATENALHYAANNPAALPDTANVQLQLDSMNFVNGNAIAAIEFVANDTHCPLLAPLRATRDHFKIDATGTSDKAGVVRHSQGFFICRELCAAPPCTGVFTAPQRSYWHTD
jgi:hypothetical protein